MISGPARACAASLIAIVALTPCSGGGKQPLDRTHVRLSLPGAPARILHTDLDGDGLQDFLVVLAYTELQSIGEDRIEDMVQISTVIPALFDRREARVFLARGDGTFDPSPRPLPLARSVIAIDYGPSGMPLLALTDDGVSEVRVVAGDPPSVELRPVIRDRPVMTGSASFFSDLRWCEDLDGDGEVDVLLPADDGGAIYLGAGGRLSSTATQRLRFPGDYQYTGSKARRSYPFPQALDVDGDGRVDLALILRAGPEPRLHVFRGQGDGTFLPLRDGDAACTDDATLVRATATDGQAPPLVDNWVHFGDLDGDGRAELVTSEEIEPAGDGMRAGMKQLKKPRQTLRLHRLREDLSLDTRPYAQIEARGHTDFDPSGESWSLFRDLDADGRLDLVTVTLDFSLLQAVKVLTTKRVSIGLDFHVWAQREDGSFREVDGLDLSEKLKLDLDNLRLGRMAQFAGDFDGDGRIDFVHLGRGKQVTVHRGGPGCSYPGKPDLVIDIGEEPRDLGLVSIGDIDGDDRADLAITRPLPTERADVSPPVVVDLYLSGSGS